MAVSSEEQRRFRDVFARFPTGVTIVTGAGPDGPVGMTTSAVTSLSLDPLLVLACLHNSARSLPVIRETGRFGVNVLRAEHGELARVFASKRTHAEKFGDVPHRLEQGVPIFDDALAWVACEVRDLLPGGDHTIGIGVVRAMGDAEGAPLVWHAGAYRRLSS